MRSVSDLSLAALGASGFLSRANVVLPITVSSTETFLPCMVVKYERNKKYKGWSV